MASQHLDITVKAHLDVPSLHSLCSPIHIQKVMMNLINNGFEAIDQSGEIHISSFRQTFSPHEAKAKSLAPGTYITIQITDTGTGMDSTTLQHIFEPFFTKKSMGRSGTGLGLAVVWGTMQEHGGTVEVFSDEKGTTFLAHLPATNAELKCSSDHQTRAILHGTETILIVDDEEIQRTLGSKILTSLGYTVDTVASGEAAIDFLKTHTVELLLLDMLMDPGLNGLSTYREIIKDHPQQRVVVASGYSANQDVQAILKLGIGAFIKKPYTIKGLGEIIREVLERGGSVP